MWPAGQRSDPRSMGPTGLSCTSQARVPRPRWASSTSTACTTRSITARRPSDRCRAAPAIDGASAALLVDGDLHRGRPGLVLGGVVEIGRGRGRLVVAGDGGEQVEVDVLLGRRGERAPVEDDLARAGLVEVDGAFLAQLLELPG